MAAVSKDLRRAATVEFDCLLILSRTLFVVFVTFDLFGLETYKIIH